MPDPDDLFTDARLRDALGARPFRFEPQLGSTNDVARQWAIDGAPSGSVVLTEAQNTGRGRFGRIWSAPLGTALLMSMILRPRVTPDRLPRLTMVGAVAVAEILEPLAPGKVSLKWPNDVMLTNRKVAGVLPEAIWQGNTLSAVILGIGLNVRVDFTDTPLADKAISLETVTDTLIDRAVLLNTLLHRIDYWSMRVDESVLLETWRAMLGTLGQRVTVYAAGAGITGQVAGVDDNGALILQDDDGILHHLLAGEVTLRG
ncbi:MAG: biotin--[acetyl-CoA-carboxylase] ligase [Chloroflexota bacterium]